MARRTQQAIDDDIEISKTEYDDIITAIKEKPDDTDEIVYRLSNNLEWIACEKEQPTPSDEPTADELAMVLLGGAV